jgi:spore coat protein A
VGEDDDDVLDRCLPTKHFLPVDHSLHATAPTTVSIPKTLRPIQRILESAAIKTRTITLHEYKDKYGMSMVMLLNRKHWKEPTTEFPKLDSTEIWEFVNLTKDTHPMHMHLANESARAAGR